MSVVAITPQTARALAKVIREAGLPKLPPGLSREDWDGYTGFVLWTWAKEMADPDTRGAQAAA